LALVAALGVAQAPAQQSAAGKVVPPRVEKDLLGEKEIPGDAYYGVQTLRALENFKLSGITIDHYPGFVEAWAMVKVAAARANTQVGAMKPDRLAAIEKATQAVLAGKYHDQFLVDWYQGGAGTSTNMNANEVLANIGLEMTGHKKGEYQFLEPHDDLNMSQSTNDSYPTAIKVALLLRNDKLIEELQQLATSFRKKGDAYIEIVKMGPGGVQYDHEPPLAKYFALWAKTAAELEFKPPYSAFMLGYDPPPDRKPVLSADADEETRRRFNAPPVYKEG
jgi:aspartate ammonia-lyase